METKNYFRIDLLVVFNEYKRVIQTIVNYLVYEGKLGKTEDKDHSIYLVKEIDKRHMDGIQQNSQIKFLYENSKIEEPKYEYKYGYLMFSVDNIKVEFDKDFSTKKIFIELKELHFWKIKEPQDAHSIAMYFIKNFELEVIYNEV